MKLELDARAPVNLDARILVELIARGLVELLIRIRRLEGSPLADPEGFFLALVGLLSN